MAECCFLVLDQGGQSSRSLVIDQTGVVLARDTHAVDTLTPIAGYVEQDAEQLVDSLKQTAESAVKQLTLAQQQALCSAALVTQRSSMLCWERDSLKPLTPVISWQDCRAESWLSQQKIDARWFRRQTGLYPNAHLGGSKMHWCLNECQAVQEAFTAGNLMMGPLAAYLAARLTHSSVIKVDPANAQRTGLYNLEANDWDEALLQLFDISRSLLPDIALTFDDFGAIPFQNFKLPLQLLNGDQSAALFANGEPGADIGYINIGTGAFVSALWHSTESPEQLLNSVIFRADQVDYVVEGTVNGAGSAITWAEKAGLLNDTLNSFEHRKKANTELLFLNSVGGLGSPYWQSLVIPELIGEGDRQQTLQAIKESILFLLQSNLQVMQSGGLHLQRVVVSGGLAGDEALCQMLSDLLNLPVWRPNEVEATARGAAYLLAREKNGARDKDGLWITQDGYEFVPRQEHHVQLHQRFSRWQKALKQKLAATAV